ncbi:peptidase C39 family protein [Porticoccus litoralis]|uniref:Peptidase C39 family protein n=1 Tax=Porticoccus litoralis TaxID=434086 RepID=A0AAW8B2U9_9GAMM|nr:peptidase C39 family protein [Porticoccus litoralis]MDP1519433.1 peptidase C39 family protein [Porticoccus litoralis]TNE93076.1 MAG: GNAT family N-acetyltransferase [Gammaproteobacteria bacterium]
MNSDVKFRPAAGSDLAALLRLEKICFTSDRLSRRSFRHWIQVDHCAFIVAEADSQLVGYSLIIFFRGTALARLYSIAIDPSFRSFGIGRKLMEEGEKLSKAAGRVFLRLEVNVDNAAAIALYNSLGYQPFGIYRNYYEDSHDALRMQKCIRTVPPVAENRAIPWIPQTTNFTCGPAALMMAMRGLSKSYSPNQHEELQIWREATTIFMTSGHGGCHPVGLALAAKQRGYGVKVWLNRDTTLFVDSVRDENKKRVIELVHQEFVSQAKKQSIKIRYRDFRHTDLINEFRKGNIPIILISTYRMDGRKAPHWVTMSGFDEDCIYVHDPDPNPDEQSASGIDNQHLPIANEDFLKMSRFGRNPIRTALILNKP